MVGYSRRGELPETVEVWSDDDGGKLQFQGGMAPIPDLRPLTSSEGSSGPHDALSARGPWNRVARCKGDPKLGLNFCQWTPKEACGGGRRWSDRGQDAQAPGTRRACSEVMR
jgi:hypothetical protein